MSTSIQNQWAKDPRCVLLLYMNGENNGTVFFDESPSAKIVTVNGDTKTVTATKRLGNASAYFDGTGDNLSLSDSDDWTFGSVWTLSAWIYVTALDATRYIFYREQDANNYIGVGSTADDVIACYVKTGGTLTTNVVTSTVILVNKWNHIGVIQSAAGTTKIYINGSEASYSSTTSATVGDMTGNFIVGSNMVGNIDSLAIWKGVAIPISDLYPTRAPLYDYAITAPDGV